MIRAATQSPSAGNSSQQSESPTQENRFLAIEIDGGAELLLAAFNGGEEMSRPFSYHLEMLSESDSIQPQEMIGRRATVRVGSEEGDPVHFNGYVNQFSPAGRCRQYYRYTAELVPWLWFLTRTRNSRIFQEMTVPEIIEQVFRDRGFTDYDVSGIRASYPRREYCVQHSESDFTFVSRLMEEEGIFYFFRHEQGRHTMVLGDGPHAHRFGTQREVEYVGSDSTRVNTEGISGWDRDYQFTAGRWTQGDYNFQTPRDDLRTSENSILDVPRNGNYEVYDFPGRHDERDGGRRLARVRMEAMEARHDVVSGSGSRRDFAPGNKFTLGGRGENRDEGQTFILTSVRHYAVEPAPYAGNRGADREYENAFTAIPDSVSYRTPRSTPKPRVQGLQTAVVVGPPGEEIHTDRFGRVKVQFHWDREHQHNEQSSCWVRVAQLMAGNRWGAHFWPRIGQEVVVSFLDGDPDRPVIVGCLYNADNMPPYDLPANQTRCGIKTRSTPGGSSENFNELRFEDKKGNEEVYLHAERVLKTVVEADESRSVGHDRKTKVENDDLLDVKETRKVTAKKILFSAEQEIELKCGGGTIKIDAGGNITINGTLVRIN